MMNRNLPSYERFGPGSPSWRREQCEPPPPFPYDFDIGPWQNPPLTSQARRPGNPERTRLYILRPTLNKRFYMFLAISQIVLGVLSFVFGCLTVMCHTVGWQLCIPIWSGAFYMVSGVGTIGGAKIRTDKWLTVAMMLSAISAILTVLPIIVCAMAASAEYSNEYGNNCSSVTTRLAMDVCIIVISLGEHVVALVAAYIACGIICKCCIKRGNRAVISVSDDVDQIPTNYNYNNPPMLIMPPSYENLVNNKDDRLILFPAVLSNRRTWDVSTTSLGQDSPDQEADSDTDDRQSDGSQEIAISVYQESDSDEESGSDAWGVECDECEECSASDEDNEAEDITENTDENIGQITEESEIPDSPTASTGDVDITQSTETFVCGDSTCVETTDKNLSSDSEGLCDQNIDDQSTITPPGDGETSLEEMRVVASDIRSSLLDEQELE